LRPLLGVTLVLGPVYLTGLVYFGFSPKTTDVGYAPEQPIPFSHGLHAGQLGLDCRYCHTTVEVSPAASLPPAGVCMNCHKRILPNSPLLKPLHEAIDSGDPIHWVRVHDLPDYVYFDHSAHLHAGVSCVECHGRVDRMDRVVQEKPLSMGWCLDCHRNPDPHLRPRELVTQLDWKPEEPAVELGRRLREENGINPNTDCSTCHR